MIGLMMNLGKLEENLLREEVEQQVLGFYDWFNVVSSIEELNDRKRKKDLNEEKLKFIKKEINRL